MSKSRYDKTREDFPKNTIGYHHQFASVFFGPLSPAVRWLEEKAEESPLGFLEPTLQAEEQIVHLLATLHFDLPNQARHQV